MFRGKPVVSTRSGGPEEVVTPETGLLAPTGNDAALGEKMKEIYDRYYRYDPNQIRSSAMERYAERSIIRRLEHVYDQVCLRAA